MLVIIPGWMHAAKEWGQVSETLTQLGVIHHILDIPGFGTVPYDDSIQTLEDLSGWCLAEIKKVQSDSPLSVVGHSCGGRVLVQLLADGLSADRAILSGSPNIYRPTLKVRIIKTLSKVFRPLRSVIPLAIRRKLRSADYEAVQGGQMQSLYENVMQSDQGELLRNIKHEVQLLWGELDDAAPLSVAHEIDSLLEKSSLEVIPKVGHNIHHEKPQLLAAKISSYVSR